MAGTWSIKAPISASCKFVSFGPLARTSTSESAWLTRLLPHHPSARGLKAYNGCKGLHIECEKKVVTIIDQEDGSIRKVKFRNQESLSDYLSITRAGFLADAEASEELYTDDFEDIQDGRTYVTGTWKADEESARMRRGRFNVIDGKEDEVAEALERLYKLRGIYVESRPELRESTGRDVSAVLVGNSFVVFGFVCTILDDKMLTAAYSMVAGMQMDASRGVKGMEYILGKTVLTALMGMYIPFNIREMIVNKAKEKQIMLFEKKGNEYKFRDPHLLEKVI